MLALGATACGAAGSGTSTTGQGAQVRARDHSSARAVQRLEARGYAVTERDSDTDGDCVDNSYGQVTTFFDQNECTALHRSLLEVRDGSARALVAVSWVDLPSRASATSYQKLVDTHGTGNVSELTRRVPWTGQRYASDRNAVTVVNAQAEPADKSGASANLAAAVASTAVS